MKIFRKLSGVPDAEASHITVMISRMRNSAAGPLTNYDLLTLRTAGHPEAIGQPRDHPQIPDSRDGNKLKGRPVSETSLGLASNLEHVHILKCEPLSCAS